MPTPVPSRRGADVVRLEAQRRASGLYRHRIVKRIVEARRAQSV